MGIYLTLEETAQLEEISYEALKKRVQRGSGLKVKIEPNENGGKDRILISLESLSQKAKRKYKAKNEVNDMSMTKLERPWYLDVDISWYKEKYKEQYYKAIDLKNTLQEFFEYKLSGRTQYAEEFAEEHGISKRTLYRYEKAYLEAMAWASKMGQEDRCSYDYFGVLALCRKPKETGLFPSISMEVKTLIENIWFDKNFASNQPTIEMLYERVSMTAEKNFWRYPSYQTVARYIHYLMEDCKTKNAYFLLQNGMREYRNKVMHKGKRDLSQLQVMEMVQGDEHTFDCWVSYKNPNGKISAIKPKLVGWIDMRSRVILGDIMCKDANAEILKQSILKMVYGDPGSDVHGVPHYILIDNGKDYTSERMTGRKRNVRRSEEIDPCMEIDAETKGFYRSIGIEDDFRALPYSGWVKAQIERFFGTVCSKFTKWMDSYVGTLTGSKTSAKIKKDVKGMLERGELLSLDEFYALWNHWLNEKYMNKPHRGLKEQGEEYTTPYGCFQNAERYEKAAPPRSYAAMLLMKSEDARVTNQGIRRFGTIYYSHELCNYINEKVAIRYDSSDLTRIYVYDRNGKQICEAESQEMLLVAPRVDQKALTDHLKEQKRQIREDREIIREKQKTLAERCQEYEEADYLSGTIDLTVSNKSKKSINKVITLPVDKQYSEKMLNKKDEIDDTDNYFSRKAQDTLNEIKKLG